MHIKRVLLFTVFFLFAATTISPLYSLNQLTTENILNPNELLLQTGQTYYVSTNGSDSNSGTIQSPFRNIRAGLRRLTPGDTLLVRGGLYTEEMTPSDFPSGNSWNQAITFRAYPGEQVTLRPNSGAHRVITLGTTARYIIIDGFIFDAINVIYNAIKIQDEPSSSSNPHHIRIMNSEIKNAPLQGLLTGARADYIELINLNVHDNGSSPLDHGIYILGSYNLLENNRVWRNADHGIQCDSGICNNNIVRNNLAYDNGLRTPYGRGIGFYRGSGNQFYNNIAWGNSETGIKVYGTTNALIYNNTVYNNNQYGIVVDWSSQSTIVRNNIVSQSNGNAIMNWGTGTTSSNNLTSGDPMFVNAAARDFHLRAGSPAINAGMTLSEVPFDFDRVSRPQGGAYDIGAYEFNSGVPPTPTYTRSPTNTTVPTNTPAPTNTPSRTNTPAPTNTPSRTNTPAPTNTPSLTPTRTLTRTPTTIPPTSTPAPGVLLVGNVLLGGRASTGNHSAPIIVQLYQNNALVAAYTPTTDAGGMFMLERVPVGTFNIWIKHVQHLAVLQTVTISAAGTPVIFGTMPAGDVNNDNRVTLQDFSILAAAFNSTSTSSSYNWRADLNGDNSVTLADFSLLASNYNLAGAPNPGG